MMPWWTLVVATVTSPTPQSLLKSTLAGPACGVATISLEQTASIPPFWEDRERYQITGRLEQGVWRDVQHVQLEDLDPSTPLEEGPAPFVLPGVGEWPGDPDVDLWDGELPTPKAVGPGWLWVDTGYRLSWQPGRVHLEAPDRVEEEGGWVEQVQWSLTTDDLGRPVRERGTLRAGEATLAANFAWSLDYRWSPCP